MLDRTYIISRTLEDKIAIAENIGQNTMIVTLDVLKEILALLKEQKAIVRCKDCKHRPKEPNFETYVNGFDIEFPEGSKCPCRCADDKYYSWYPEDDWFCANGAPRD